MSSAAQYFLPAIPNATARSSTSPQAQTADVKMFDEPDGGDIEIVNGVVTMSDGLDTAAYLSLFGGNEDDSGLKADDRQQWWGNLSETDPAKVYRSRTQNLLRALPAIPVNLLRIQDAATADLAWFVSSGVASKVAAVASMPARNRVSLKIEITIGDLVYRTTFLMNWGVNQ